MSALLTVLWSIIKPHALLVGAFLIVSLGSFGFGYHVGHHETPPPVAVQAAHQATVVSEQAQVPIKAAAVRQEATLTKAMTRYDTVRAVLPFTITTPVLVPPEYVQACDTLRKDAAAYVDSAKALRGADSVVSQSLHHELQAVMESQPSRLLRVVHAAGWIATGIVVDRIATHAHLSVVHYRF